jgi:hypothetical protein
VRRLLAFIVCFFVGSVGLVSGAFYADTTFYVDADGSVSVQGSSNHPGLASGVYENLTSSSDGVEVFQVSINESFSDYLFTVDLPGGAELISVESAASTRIISGDRGLRIRGVAENKPFSVRVEYAAEEQQSVTWWPYLVAAILAGFAATYWYVRDTWEPPRDVNDRQRRILVFLHGRGGEATQSTVAEELGFPKSSTSRNLDTLERKGYVDRIDEGNAKTVVLRYE